jgi:hypothetical protein
MLIVCSRVQETLLGHSRPRCFRRYKSMACASLILLRLLRRLLAAALQDNTQGGFHWGVIAREKMNYPAIKMTVAWCDSIIVQDDI